MARPLTPKLDLERIVRTAVQLCDEHGDFTLGQIAKRLKVHPSSMYHHVAGRDEVIEHMRAWFASRIDSSSLDTGPWDEALRRLAWSYRSSFAPHPGCIRLLASSRVRDDDTLVAFEAIAALLDRSGFTAGPIVPILMALDSYVLGSALEPADDDLYSTDDEQHPTLARSVRAGQDTGRMQDIAFELGLDALLTGFKTLLGPTSRAPRAAAG